MKVLWNIFVFYGRLSILKHNNMMLFRYLLSEIFKPMITIAGL